MECVSLIFASLFLDKADRCVMLYCDTEATIIAISTCFTDDKALLLQLLSARVVLNYHRS
jgi:hypothetical protein